MPASPAAAARLDPIDVVFCRQLSNILILAETKTAPNKYINARHDLYMSGGDFSSPTGILSRRTELWHAHVTWRQGNRLTLIAKKEVLLDDDPRSSEVVLMSASMLMLVLTNMPRSSGLAGCIQTSNGRC